MERFARQEMLLGADALQQLAAKHVAVFGIGGVGGHVCEALVRAGVGALSFFDGDVVEKTNINRQIVALSSTLGRPKAEVMAQRAADINPECKVQAHVVFYTAKTADEYPLERYDYVVDAVDMVSAKLELISRAKKAGVPIISSMGTGNKLCAEGFSVMDIADTSMCPLARVMRKELKARGIEGVRVVCSGEAPLQPAQKALVPAGRRAASPASISFVPAAAGMVLAGEVVRNLLQQ